MTTQKNLIPTILSLAVVSPVFAQTPESSKPSYVIEEVVVTSQRREQSLQDVPMAVSALGEQFMQESGVTEVNDVIAYSPGLNGSKQGAVTPIFSIRGIHSTMGVAIGSEQSVGVFLDDAYIGRDELVALGFIDTARVEVLKGPQGTLFGRNTSAGAISITSNAPNEEPELTIKQTIARYNTLKTAATANVPLFNDRLLTRTSLTYESSDGYLKNKNTGENQLERNVLGGKFSASYDISNNLSASLRVLAMNAENGGRQIEYEEGSTFHRLAEVDSDLFDGNVYHTEGTKENVNATLTSLRLNWDIRDDVSLASITGYSNYNSDVFMDFDSIPQKIMGLTIDRGAYQHSQEFRLTGTGERVAWLLGASYFHERIFSDDAGVQYNDRDFIDFVTEAQGLGQQGDAVCAIAPITFGKECGDHFESRTNEAITDSHALYTDISIDLIDSLTLTVGLRYSDDQKSFYEIVPRVDSVTNDFVGLATGVDDNTTVPSSPNGINLDLESSQWTPRVALSWRASDELMFYASAGKGYKGGGFNPAAGDDLSFATYGKELSWSYELGAKTEWLERRLLVNASVFRYDYRGLQVEVFENAVARTLNAPEVTGEGIELEIVSRPLESLDIIASLAYLDTRFGHFVASFEDSENENLTGNSTAQSPRTTASLVAQYGVELGNHLELKLRGESVYRDEFYFSIRNRDNESQEALTLYNARIILAPYDESWSLSLFGKNLTDEEYFVESTDQLGFGTGATRERGEPLTYGIQGQIRF
jgi:iron complex outermembrane receptor protein